MNLIMIALLRHLLQLIQCLTYGCQLTFHPTLFLVWHYLVHIQICTIGQMRRKVRASELNNFMICP